MENFDDLLAEFAAYEPQLVLMDVSLPHFNGYYWCAEIRKVSKVPIIFISSASDIMNIVMAMNMGIMGVWYGTVSYTHLDVYKRQISVLMRAQASSTKSIALSGRKRSLI